MKLHKVASRCLPLLFGSLLLPALACTAEEHLGDHLADDPGDASSAPDASNRVDSGSSEDDPVEDAGEDEPKDKTKPSVTLTASATQFTAPGELTFTAAVTHAKKIAKVTLYSGGTALTGLAQAPYIWKLPLTAADNGTRVFTARAVDVDVNTGISSSVTVTVNITTPPPPIPSFVAASAPVLAASSTSLTIGTPAGVQTDDLLIALVDADEGSGSRTMNTPSGWTLLGGFPLHNLSTSHTPFVIPTTQNHGTWIFHKFAGAGEPASVPFAFTSATTSRGVVVAYRGVAKANPIHDKSAFNFYGSGSTNGLGSGNTTLTSGRQINLIATATTTHATYTVVTPDSDRNERVNTGEQPNGLGLVISDEPIFSKLFFGPSIANKQSPSGTSDGFMFSTTTLVLTPE